ncbi:DUF2569 domain-containing protein [Terracidiphilus gabretensis]|uniref:DUF2569 domain-containing protein n=1 Tax=Terracidiphilus gabretensis TaxID=1577687 RepID=UPI00071B7183|nr:DUF2569 domain-containing protein [Terracidiphilus gabretensis]
MQSAAVPVAASASALESTTPVYEAPDLFTSSSLDSDRHLEGLSGWLILVGIGLVLSPVIILFRIFTVHLRVLINPHMQSYLQTHGTLHALILVEAITNVLLVLMLVWLNYLFFTKRRAFPTFMIFYFVFQCIFIAGDHFAAVFLLAKPSSSLTLVRTFVAAAVWIPYYLRSRRVKVTFVH